MNTDNCPHCGRSMRTAVQRLTPGLVRLLIRAIDQAAENGKNEVMLREMGDVCASPTKYNNFPKLRYFGLIQKVRDEDDKVLKGHWLITSHAAAFLRGSWEPHREVETFNNRIIRRSDETVTVEQVMGERPEWKTEWTDAGIYRPGEQAALL